MIRTSYFAKYKESDAVAICRGVPTWYRGDICDDIAPPWNLVQAVKNGSISHSEFEIKYIELLNAFDVHEIAELFNNRTLLCYEKSGEFCHRHIVAKWLRENGYNCEEVK